MTRSAIPEADISLKSPGRYPGQAGTFVPYLRPHELAERWSISPKTLGRWRWIGAGPRFLKVSGKVLYRLEDIEAFEAAHIRSRTEERPTLAVVHPFTPKRGKRRDPVIAAIAPGSLRHRRVANR